MVPNFCFPFSPPSRKTKLTHSYELLLPHSIPFLSRVKWASLKSPLTRFSPLRSVHSPHPVFYFCFKNFEQVGQRQQRENFFRHFEQVGQRRQRENFFRHFEQVGQRRQRENFFRHFEQVGQ